MHDARLKRLRKLLKEQSLDAIFISSLPNITYFTKFSGFSTEDRDAFLLITKDEQYIFTHGIYREAVKKAIADFTLIEMKRENPISSALYELVSTLQINKLGFEAFDLRVSEYENIIKQIDKDILVSTDIVGELRIKKDSGEINAIEKACQLGDTVFTQIIKEIKEGVTEKELAAKLDYCIKKQNADVSFPTIIAFGDNAAYPHHVPTDRKLQKNEFVLLDFGVKLNGYCSDMTRTVCFGKANTEQKHIYNTVKSAQQAAIDAYDEGPMKASSLDLIAREFIIKNSYPNMPHSLGHGIGLEVHELPRLTPVSKDVLENGMVFSIEPGIYLVNNVGVRIEDLFAIVDNKLIQLTHSPRELIEL